MRKILPVLLTVLVLAAAGAAFAQSQTQSNHLDFDARSYYAQGMITLPTGDFGDVAGTGVGAGLGVFVPYSEKLNFRGEAGYIFFGGEEVDLAVGSYEYSFGMIPLTALAEYRMNVDSPAYFLGGLGLTIVRGKVEYTYPDPISGGHVTDEETDSNTELTLTLGGGYDLNEQVSVEGRINLISDSNYISVHGTYAF